MKKYPLLPFAIILLLVSVFTVWATAARTGSWTETRTDLTDNYRICTLFWTADSTGTVPSYTTTTTFRGIIYQVTTDPDTTVVPADSTGRKPSDNYDIVLNQTKVIAGVGTALDIMGGSLADRDSINAEMVVPKTIDKTEWPFFINSKLTVLVTGNTKPNARGYIIIKWIWK